MHRQEMRRIWFASLGAMAARLAGSLAALAPGAVAGPAMVPARYVRRRRRG